ncbi:MAG TPA: hypothetical protein VN457_07610, partial [Chlamydiales bacterium]|nr:hypothetical protein [Chlamydiales bacterium]
ALDAYFYEAASALNRQFGTPEVIVDDNVTTHFQLINPDDSSYREIVQIFHKELQRALKIDFKDVGLTSAAIDSKADATLRKIIQNAENWQYHK